MTVKELGMQWRDPASPGTSDPCTPIVVGGGGGSVAAFGIEEFPARGEGDLWSWLVTWHDGSKTRYFRAFPGGLGVTAVHYFPNPEERS